MNRRLSKIMMIWGPWDGRKEKTNSDYDKKYIDRAWNADGNLKRKDLLGVLKLDVRGKTLSLTKQGYELGTKYSTRSGIFCSWCKEYKEILTIIGLILTFLIVILMSISTFRK